MIKNSVLYVTLLILVVFIHKSVASMEDRFGEGSEPYKNILQIKEPIKLERLFENKSVEINGTEFFLDVASVRYQGKSRHITDYEEVFQLLQTLIKNKTKINIVKVVLLDMEIIGTKTLARFLMELTVGEGSLIFDLYPAQQEVREDEELTLSVLNEIVAIKTDYTKREISKNSIKKILTNFFLKKEDDLVYIQDNRGTNWIVVSIDPLELENVNILTLVNEEKYRIAIIRQISDSILNREEKYASVFDSFDIVEDGAKYFAQLKFSLIPPGIDDVYDDKIKNFIISMEYTPESDLTDD